MYKVTIGLEIHTELLTKSKMFSTSKNNVDDAPNTNINEIDLSHPGTLPMPNKRAIELAIVLAKILKMKIDPVLQFDRKNYFYQDLPKGYQITQQFHPIGTNGELNGVAIERIHLEEDTAKQFNDSGEILLDYNRAGVPLIEIVTKPVIHSKERAIDFLTALKQNLIFCGISDGKMESGSLRVDLNISLANANDNVLGSKVEVKNINSFSNLAKAIEFEIERQTNILNSGDKVKPATRRFDDTKYETVFMRDKGEETDYRYFTEPNIIPINIQHLIDAMQIPKLPNEIKDELISHNLSENIINQLLDNYEQYKLFILVNKQVNNPALTLTWVVVELPKILTEQKISISQLEESTIKNFIDMLKFIQEGKINGKQAKTILLHIIVDKQDPQTIINQHGFVQVTDENELLNKLNSIKERNIEFINANLHNIDKVKKHLMGELMKETRGQANPVVANKLLDKIIN
ncbi:MAG: Asp-tRNA(Asn)/Glu-tRNA(Gln) amidotransferase subunit GatB [Mycoplasmataceae bacterium]|jgi:aspartyl-tRNA(Asn)/glutamyl-tRNA(Gln) amidotransferase subunit B|nr:Asp-tRNA(Asn)/Glu-tRNA(Gln) amidotransferase subunit GatB [Mycoplasmataceae bacterium]